MTFISSSGHAVETDLRSGICLYLSSICALFDISKCTLDDNSIRVFQPQGCQRADGDTLERHRQLVTCCYLRQPAGTYYKRVFAEVCCVRHAASVRATGSKCPHAQQGMQESTTDAHFNSDKFALQLLKWVAHLCSNRSKAAGYNTSLKL